MSLPAAAETGSPDVRRVTVVVNGLSLQTSAPTLDALLMAQGFADTKVATAVNGTFVAARQRAAWPLAEGDHIEVVSARQGG